MEVDWERPLTIQNALHVVAARIPRSDLYVTPNGAWEFVSSHVAHSDRYEDSESERVMEENDFAQWELVSKDDDVGVVLESNDEKSHWERLVGCDDEHPEHLEWEEVRYGTEDATLSSRKCSVS